MRNFSADTIAFPDWSAEGALRSIPQVPSRPTRSTSRESVTLGTLTPLGPAALGRGLIVDSLDDDAASRNANTEWRQQQQAQGPGRGRSPSHGPPHGPSTSLETLARANPLLGKYLRTLPRLHLGPSVLTDPDHLAQAHEIARMHWETRRPLIVVLNGMDLRSLATRDVITPDVDNAYYAIGPSDIDTHTFDRGAHTHAYLTANNYQYTAATVRAGYHEPVWPEAQRALALFRSSIAPLRTAAGDVGINGRAVWLDGGPHTALRPDQLHGIPICHIDTVASAHELAGYQLAVDGWRVTPSNTEGMSDEQREVVTHVDGYAWVSAPAGAGKTRSITERMKYLARELRWDPKRIVAIAYNTRARDEMKQRTNTPGILFATLNGLGYAICQGRNGFVTPSIAVPNQLAQFNTTSPAKSDRTYISILSETFFPGKARPTRDDMESVIRGLTQVRLAYRDAEEVGRDIEVPAFGVATVYEYERRMHDANLMDFDGQVVWAIRILAADPKARFAAQLRVGTLIVDEAQDLRPAHLTLLSLLNGHRLQEMRIGDANQVIYRYDGADPASLTVLPNLHPRITQIQFLDDFRNTADVVTATNNLLRKGSDPQVVSIRGSHLSDRQHGLAAHAVPPNQEVFVTVRQIADLIANGVSPSEIAVLSRVNRLLTPIQIALAAEGITASGEFNPRQLFAGVNGIAIALLRIAADPTAVSKKDLQTAFSGSRFKDGFVNWKQLDGTTFTLSYLQDRFSGDRDMTRFLESAGAFGKRVRGESRVGKRVANPLSVEEALGVIDREFLAESSQRHARETTRGGEDAMVLEDNRLALLLQLAPFVQNAEDFPGWLDRHFATTTKQGAQKGVDDDDLVTLSSIHRTKGLEWPHVFLPMFTGDLYPLKSADDLAEERRIAYVGLTRAKETTTIVYDRGNPSPYLADMGLDVRDGLDLGRSLHQV